MSAGTGKAAQHPPRPLGGQGTGRSGWEQLLPRESSSSTLGRHETEEGVHPGKGAGTRRRGSGHGSPLPSRTLTPLSQLRVRPGTGSPRAVSPAPPRPRPRAGEASPGPAPEPAGPAPQTPSGPALTMVLGPLVAAYDLLALPGRGLGGRRRVNSNQHVLEDAVGIDVHIGDPGEVRRRHVPCRPRPFPPRARVESSPREAGSGSPGPIARGHACWGPEPQPIGPPTCSTAWPMAT